MTVRGRLVTGSELSVLFSPDCHGDFQPLTWVELPSPTRGLEKLARALKNGHQVSVVLKGDLFGPTSFRELIEKSSTLVPRSAGRFGHANQFRTKLVVSEVIEAVAASPVAVPELDSDGDRFAVIAADLPAYPVMARRFGVAGDVELVVTVADGRVTDVETAAQGVLARAAVANVRTWRFAEGTSGKVNTRFVYRLDDTVPTNAIQLTLSATLVTITASADKW